MRPLDHTDPRTIGPYRLLAEIGRGGMGRVLLGASPDGRLVAVKQVHARFATDDGFRARFLREVTASRQVPGACTAAVLDADAYAPMPWLASTFVFGPSLGTAMAASGVLPEASVRRLAAGLATALVEIHQAGLIHRDLKPDNVLLAEDGVRVIDFGIARAAETGTATELTQSGWVVGTPGFMSPEQAEGSDLTPASDVFSLGSVLAMAATGRSPFAGPGTPQTLYNLVHAAPDLNGVPPGLRGIIEPCLAKDPAARPTPRQLLEMIGLLAPSDRHWPPVVQELTAVQRAQIDRLLSTGFLPVAPPPPSPPPRRRTGTIAALAAAGASGVLAIGIAAYALWPQGGTAAAHVRSSPPSSRSSAASSSPAEPDKYVKMPVCSQAAAKLPLPQRDTSKDLYRGYSDQALTTCTWPHAVVSWDLRRTLRTTTAATQLQRTTFAASAAKGSRETGLGLGDEAYWDPPKAYQTCGLNVRDHNLIVSVALGSADVPTCESDAKKIIQAALTAMPR